MKASDEDETREAGFQKQGGILGDWLGVGFAGTGREKQERKQETVESLLIRGWIERRIPLGVSLPQTLWIP